VLGAGCVISGQWLGCLVDLLSEVLVTKLRAGQLMTTEQHFNIIVIISSCVARISQLQDIAIFSGGDFF